MVPPSLRIYLWKKTDAFGFLTVANRCTIACAELLSRNYKVRAATLSPAALLSAIVTGFAHSKKKFFAHSLQISYDIWDGIILFLESQALQLLD